MSSRDKRSSERGREIEGNDFGDRFRPSKSPERRRHASNGSKSKSRSRSRSRSRDRHGDRPKSRRQGRSRSRSRSRSRDRERRKRQSKDRSRSRSSSSSSSDSRRDQKRSQRKTYSSSSSPSRSRSRSPLREAANSRSDRDYDHGYDARGFGGRGSASNYGGADDFYSLGSAGSSKARSNSGPMQPIQKNFYTEHPEVAKMTADVVAQKRKELNIAVVGHNVAKPVLRFEHSSFSAEVVSALYSSGFSGPTGIQAQGWPVILSGSDVIGLSATGSGKTLAFLLPGIVHIKAQKPLARNDGPIMLVLAPTRELALQIEEQCVKFGRSTGVRYTCLTGGTPKGPQVRALRNGVEVVIATPGRLIDMLKEGSTNMDRITYLVLDEADRMLDMGFEPQIRVIINKIRKDRQTLMFSATWPKEVRGLARDFQVQPVQITIGSIELAANKSIQQIIIASDPNSRKSEFLSLLYGPCKDGKTLIFTETKRDADSLYRYMSSKGFAVEAIHGDKMQQVRLSIFADFKSGRLQYLVATDVAARGLDVKDIKYVINYDFPRDLENYVHRIGRTGRGGATGVAYSFFFEKDSRLGQGLVDILREAEQPVPESLLRRVEECRHTGSSSGGRRSSYSSGGGRYGGSSYQNRSSYSGYSHSGQYSNSHSHTYADPTAQYPDSTAAYYTQPYTASSSAHDAAFYGAASYGMRTRNSAGSYSGPN